MSPSAPDPLNYSETQFKILYFVEEQEMNAGLFSSIFWEGDASVLINFLWPICEKTIIKAKLPQG